MLMAYWRRWLTRTPSTTRRPVRGYRPQLLSLERREVPTTVTVDVGPASNSMTFSPANTTIHVGDTVHWVWDTDNHSVTSGTCNGATCTADGKFDSGVHNTGFTFDQTFNSAGTTSYFCSIHGPMGMTGTINVLAGTPGPTPSSPTLSIGNVRTLEGQKGFHIVHFSVHLSQAASSAVTVSYKTVNGTAHAGTDYLPAVGKLTFKPGQTNLSIAVKIKGDTIVEPNETFFVVLSRPRGATLAKGKGTGTIVNDDHKHTNHREGPGTTHGTPSAPSSIDCSCCSAPSSKSSNCCDC
jgi:plastocyanin